MVAVDQRIFLAAFNEHPALGPIHLSELKQRIRGDWERLWSEDPPRINSELKLYLHEARAHYSPSTIEKTLAKHSIHLVLADDPGFPALLTQIPTPPLLLYVKGDAGALLRVPMVAIVGTRKITPYGRNVTEFMVEPLVRAGCATVSGLALGVDAAVHRATLTQKGITVGVLPCGILTVYPSSNETLARAIVKGGGALISEFPLSSRALKFHFLQRNRLIAGLAPVTVVIEAQEHSGTQITARAALEAGREVFAVPSSIFSPSARGPHHLIKEGARLLDDPAEILEELGLHARAARAPYIASVNEAQVLRYLPLGEAVDRDRLVELAGLSASALNGTLTELELKQIIQRVGNNQVERVTDFST